MKKLFSLVCVALALLLLAACGTEPVEESPVTTTEATTVAESVKIKVAKSTLEEPENFKDDMEKYGAEVAVSSEDNSFEFTFSATDYAKLLKDKSADAVSAFKQFEDDEAKYIEKVEYDENFRNLKIYVDKEKYDSDSSKSLEFAVAANALAYQVYLEDGQKTFVKVYYTGTDTEVLSFTLPMAMNLG